MASSIVVRCGGGGVLRSPIGEWRNRSNDRGVTMARMIGGGRMKEVRMMMNLKKKKRNQISISCSCSCSSPLSTTAETAADRVATRRKRREEESVSSQNVIDEWMRDSVVEIVQNLRDAPLLVHVYSDGDGSGRRLRTEKAEVEDWITMRSQWEKGMAKKPEGVIFVEQLRKDDGVVEEDEESSLSTDVGGASEVTRAWGVVVQSKGENCGPACYLLKTTRAGAGSGLGLCCTHFCLVKVKSFRETAEAQFMHSWLLNGK